MDHDMDDKTYKQTKARFRLGATIFIIGFCSPLLIPLVTATDLPIKWKATLSGALALGIPELFSVIAIAIMGKPGFQQLKNIFFGFIKKHGPAEKVSLTRYRIGLIMFVLSVLMGWLAPYGPDQILGHEPQGLPVNIVFDLMFFSSFFVLGGEFWDKIQALFIYGAKVEITRNNAQSTSDNV
jgi:hypothetical protein